ncbi:MAG: tetratricopeptide repeat protein [Acidobacteriota bacterium]
MKVGFIIALVLAIPLATLHAKTPEWDRAYQLYQKTEYKQSLALLRSAPRQDSDSTLLIGKNYYGLGDYKDATDALEKAAALAPKSSEIQGWLGRAWGRRADTSMALLAPHYAGKARDAFETAVQLDPNNHDALDDLFEYYMAAPGFLGGGIDKAEALARHIASLDAAWGQRVQAQILLDRKDFNSAEQHLRQAVELAPKQVGRVLDLAKYLARRGRTQESDAVFAEAAKIAPQDPEVVFARAKTLIEQKRNLPDARRLLEQYMSLSLTPENPSRAEAAELLKKTSAR